MSKHYSAKAYSEATNIILPPGQLVLMLFDGALRFMGNARKAFDEPNFFRGSEDIHNNLAKTQAIITELQATLNLEAGGEFGQTMYRLYDFMREQLRLANVNRDPEPIKVVQKFLGDIRDAWAQMLEQTEKAGAPSGATSDKLAATC